jgi:CHAT domain-containing protein
MKIFVLVLQKNNAQYNATLHMNNATNNPLASHSFAVNVADVVKRFQETQAGNDLLALGQELYNLVAPALTDFLKAREHSESARLLLDIRDDALKLLPWELMSNHNLALFRDPAFPISRARAFEGALPSGSPKRDWPLRMLIVVASQKNDPDVAAEEEVVQIVDAIVPHEAAIDWKLMKRPKREKLLRTFEQFKPHIFHFIGHGGISHGEPELKLFDPVQNKNDSWNVITLRDNLTGKANSLHLAFINACRTAEAARDGLWTVTDAFLDAGATAVIGTRAVITGSAAARCAGTFYAELFKHLAIDRAMAQARTQVSDIRERDWAALSLELRLPPPKLFSSCKTLHAKPSEVKRLFWKVCKYVGRQNMYYKAWQTQLADKKRLPVIRGADQAGKTAMAEMLLERCLLADHVVRYVNMRQRGSDYVDLMRATLKGDDPPPLLPLPHTQQFPTTVSEAFEQQLPQILGEKLDQRKPTNVRKLFDSFHELIEDAYPDKPILLVYDHLDDIETISLVDIIAQFARWHQEGGRVHPLLVISDYKEQELRRKNILIAEPHFSVMMLNLFEPQQYRDLSSEFVRRLVIARQVRSNWQIDDYEEYREKAMSLVLGAQDQVQENWRPVMLTHLEAIMVLNHLLPEAKDGA